MKKFVKKSVLSLMTMVALAPSATIFAQEESENFIADREIVGLIFQSANDASVDIPQEILDEIKRQTGITLTLQTVTADDSTSALAAGLAAGDLPDFIAYYLNNSGRPEMSLLLNAANQGMFHDLTPLMQMDGIEIYSKYLEEDYLPQDTRENIMFREEWGGSSYLMHMAIDREPAQLGYPSVGGLYIKQEIVDALGIDPLEINTSDELYELAVQIKEGQFVDDNGAPITVIGPTAWGGSDRQWLYHDKVWTGTSGEKFTEDEEGNILHESQTDVIMDRVAYVQKLMAEGLMTQEYYTMEETRAKEGIVNGSFGIVADMHNYMPENNDMAYIPLGPIERIDGTNDEVLRYKSGYAGWSIPITTENPEEVMQFADWSASYDGKLLYMYGLEGRDYTMGEDGFPVINPETYQLVQENPDEAKKLGFRGARSYWGEHLGWTDMDNITDFGENRWGDNISREGEATTGQKIAEMWGWEERMENARVIDGMTVQSFLYEFQGDDGGLATALERYEEDVQRMYYAGSVEAAQQILEETRANLERNDLQGFLEFVKNKRDNEGISIRY